MKRIKEACICQTLHFMLKEDVGHDYAVKVVKEEITKYKILEETEQPDGSVIIKIKKQYNTAPVGSYLD